MSEFFEWDRKLDSFWGYINNVMMMMMMMIDDGLLSLVVGKL